MKAQKLNRRQARQALYLLRFDFALKHIASKSIEQANSLNSRVDQAEEVERDNENQVMLKSEWLEIRVMEMEQVFIEERKEEIMEKIKKSETKDNKVVNVVKEIKKERVKVLRNDEWQIENDLVLKEKKVCVPKDKELRLKIIWLHHDMPIVGHREQQKTVELVTRNYWWPGVTKNIKQYVEEYNQCYKMKNRVQIPAGKLRNYNSILVVCDKFSKMSHFIVTTEKNSERVSEIVQR